jgi:flagellar basal body P-ring protein FlgI
MLTQIFAENFRGIKMPVNVRRSIGLLVVFVSFALARARSNGEAHRALIRDIATVEGVRDNSLIGYGLVVGL